MAEQLQREMRRISAVSKVKATPAYINACTPRPQTPDPRAQISKRRWEVQMMIWRRALRGAEPAQGTAHTAVGIQIRPSNGDDPGAATSLHHPPQAAIFVAASTPQLLSD